MCQSRPDNARKHRDRPAAHLVPETAICSAGAHATGSPEHRADRSGVGATKSLIEETERRDRTARERGPARAPGGYSELRTSQSSSRPICRSALAASARYRAICAGDSWTAKPRSTKIWAMTDASQPQPDRRTIWAVRVIQAVLMIGALALVGHHALGVPSTDQLHVAMSYGNRVNSVLYMVGAACVLLDRRQASPREQRAVPAVGRSGSGDGLGVADYRLDLVLEPPWIATEHQRLTPSS